MVSAPPAPPPFRVSQRCRYRELLGLVAVQSFGNQMTGSFWIVYLVSLLDFRVATLLWVIAFLTAALGVLLMARGRPIPARTSMTVGLATMAAGHFAFAFLPANWVVLVGGIAFGIYLPLFWLPMNSLLVRETSPANRAGRLAGVTATFTTVAVVAPVLDGYLAVTVGFPFLFSLGGLILAANLLLAPALSAPACLLAFASRDLGSFAFAIGWLSMSSVVAPSYIYTTLVDRMEDPIPAVTATREFILNTSRSVALFAGLLVLAFGGDVYALYLLVGGVILLEALAK